MTSSTSRRFGTILSLGLLAAALHPAAGQYAAYDGFATPGSYRSDGGYADPTTSPSNALLFDPTATAGDADVGQNPTTLGFSGAWASTSSFSSSVYPRIQASQLGYTDSQNAELLTSSGQLNLFRSGATAAQKTISRDFSLSNNLPEELFISFLVRYTPETVNNPFGLSIVSNDGTTATNRTFGLQVDTNTGAMDFTGSGVTGSLSAGTLTANTTHLVVLRLANANFDGTLGGGTTGDTLQVYIDPILGSIGANPEPTALGSSLAGFYVSGNSSYSFRSLSLNFGPSAGNSVILDEFRVGTTFADVTPAVPEPGTAGLLVLGLAAVGARRWRRRG